MCRAGPGAEAYRLCYALGLPLIPCPKPTWYPKKGSKKIIVLSKEATWGFMSFWESVIIQSIYLPHHKTPKTPFEDSNPSSMVAEQKRAIVFHGYWSQSSVPAGTMRISGSGSRRQHQQYHHYHHRRETQEIKVGAVPRVLARKAKPETA